MTLQESVCVKLQSWILLGYTHCYGKQIFFFNILQILFNTKGRSKRITLLRSEIRTTPLFIFTIEALTAPVGTRLALEWCLSLEPVSRRGWRQHCCTPLWKKEPARLGYCSRYLPLGQIEFHSANLVCFHQFIGEIKASYFIYFMYSFKEIHY